MRININIMALNACSNLNRADKQQSESIERLSSGYRINSSKDNPVGAALSAKMKSQLKNLEKAQQSTSDGISVIETAESVLAEVQSMVQRVRELCVQGANDTYTDADRESLMAEIDQLRTEIDRVADSTDFNTKKLLNGDLGRCTYTNTNYVEVTYVATDVDAGEYQINILNKATRAEYESGAITAGVEGRLTINDADVEILKTDTLDDIYGKIRDAADKSGVKVENDNGVLTYTNTKSGSANGINIECDDEAIRDALGFESTNIDIYGTDIEVELVTNNPSRFLPTATADCDGNDITITDRDGFELRVEIDENIPDNERRVLAYVTDIGTMTVQTGANEGQNVNIDIPRVDSHMMGLDDLMAYTGAGAAHGITICDEAISYISEVRSRIGAYDNRMSHTEASLDITVENMTAAYSRIIDTDMAEEMTNFTNYNVITQAATSMLAQANALPEKVLQLLQ